jgi:hypothetical protein
VDAFDYGEERVRAAKPEAPAPETAHESDPIRRLAADVGNHAFSALAREGAGILPDGRAHPDVEAAIGRTQGRGQTLPPSVRARFEGPLGDSLDDVRVHANEEADALARSVSARAFATGSDVYFAQGEYRPGSKDGDELLAHELAHVVQQRGAQPGGPLAVSSPQDALEVEADEAARELLG